ncbi:LysE family translocator [Pusillimonas sp. T7-7]|uniref:LysE family translocator n=1 Tax=Pusillimonas sp. (strain T7-7) TaxID=1007105 RepID=UPI00059F4B44|nr:LysE family translocator [Pusillimonas sp. T7-7]
MTVSVLLSLIVFTFVNSITPGPNNVMLTASGSTFGYRRSLPHMLGITIGVSVMVLLVGAGLGAVFEAMPMLYTVLKYVGAAYLLYLAWRIARAGSIDGGQARGKPFSFIQAAAFQWVNPKAWLMAVGIVAAYMPQENFYWNLTVATLVVSLVNFPSISVWTLFGSAVRRLLHRPESVQRFNIAMAILLVASLYGVVSV